MEPHPDGTSVGGVVKDKFESITVRRGDTPVFGIADWSDMGRKKPVLWIQDSENCRVKVASFNDVSCAKMFADLLVKLFEKGGCGEEP